MNKRGFFAVSIIFSFFVVFLLILTLNLATYAQNRILLGQVKSDIKSTIKLDLPLPKCIMETTTPILEYGSILKCDVNGDRNYADDEKFVYISDRYNYATDSTTPDNDEDYYLVLLYKTPYNTKCPSGMMYTDTNYYTYGNTRYYYGPQKAKDCLPTIQDWPNMRLADDSRALTDDDGTLVPIWNTYKWEPSTKYYYQEKAARFATYQEIYEYVKSKILEPNSMEIDDYLTLKDYTTLTYYSYYFDNIKSNTGVYWLESYDKGDLDKIWGVSSTAINTYSYNAIGEIRPVIEVNIKEIQKNE